MTSSWQVVLIRCRYEPRIIAFILAFIRIAICFLPQTGYIHPDEFFQSTDIVGGKYFNSHIQPVWEFKTEKPIRCMLIPTIFNYMAFKLATLICRNPSAYWLLVAPRLVYTIMSFIVDACLYKLCQYYSSRGLWYLPVSIIFQSSFICLGCMTRTFNNVPEVILFALLLVVVCRLIRPRFRILFVTPTRSTPAHETVKRSTQLLSSILIGFIVTLGIFNRPTFPCFALVPLIYWFTESFKRNSCSISLTLGRVITPVALTTMLTFILLSSFDTAYYKSTETLRELLQLLSKYKFNEIYHHLQNNWVVTPYNFIRYNSNVDNLAKYGLHAPYVHMLVNIPLAFNALGLMFYSKLISLMVGSGVYRLIFSTHRVYALMILSTLTSTILLSFIPHQEFRFLLPLIVPLAYAFAFNIYTSNRWLSIWLIANLILVYFYSSVHQAGPIRASLDLDPIFRSHSSRSRFRDPLLVDVLAFKCYLVPSYQWNIPQEDKRFGFSLQETFEDLDESLDAKLGAAMERKLVDEDEYEHKIYMMLPSIYMEQLRAYIDTNYTANLTNFKTLQHYWPHFSGEDFQAQLGYIRQNGLSRWRQAFGFHLIEAEVVVINQELNQDD